MRFVLKLMANLTDPRGGDAMDKVDQRSVPTGPGGLTGGEPAFRVTTRALLG